jgi:hypothetical protein
MLTKRRRNDFERPGRRMEGRRKMSRKNSLLIEAEKVTIETKSDSSLVLRITAPSNATLMRLINEASSLLEWRMSMERDVTS